MAYIYVMIKFSFPIGGDISTHEALELNVIVFDV